MSYIGTICFELFSTTARCPMTIPGENMLPTDFHCLFLQHTAYMFFPISEWAADHPEHNNQGIVLFPVVINLDPLNQPWDECSINKLVTSD